ncbi:hypothetical protein [Streptomyces sp. NPDC048196]|uniref:hypothetical protein n=1 Tax=Streptomyces sp. NPDC048196 TaxID=3154712 RepID=UPI00340C6227
MAYSALLAEVAYSALLTEVAYSALLAEVAEVARPRPSDQRWRSLVRRWGLGPSPGR